jgi:hypothetical protein
MEPDARPLFSADSPAFVPASAAPRLTKSQRRALKETLRRLNDFVAVDAAIVASNEAVLRRRRFKPQRLLLSPAAVAAYVAHKVAADAAFGAAAWQARADGALRHRRPPRERPGRSLS